MENNEFKFKTNLNCGDCVAKVKNDLDNNVTIAHWEVDINNADKILTVISKGITPENIIEIIQNKGFKIETINS